MTLILFTTSAPNTLADELARLGHNVYEALAISEVVALAEQHPASQIVIAPEVDQERAGIVQQHWPALNLKFGATVADIIWELKIPLSRC